MPGKENRIAKRYARALVKSLKNAREYARIREELETYREISWENIQLKSGMETLLFSKAQKRELIKSLNRKIPFHRKTLNFLLSLVDENRVSLLSSILGYLEDLWLEKSGAEKLTVFSVIELNPQLERELKDGLKKWFNKEVILKKEIDKSLIGGIKIQRGYTYFDFSILGNLTRLREKLVEG